MQPFIVISIICGMWGISMTMRVLGEILKDHGIQGKFVVLQLVLVLAKLQGLAFRGIVWAGWLPCKPPISPTVYANCTYPYIYIIIKSTCIQYLTYSTTNWYYYDILLFIFIRSDLKVKHTLARRKSVILNAFLRDTSCHSGIGLDGRVSRGEGEV